MFGSIICIPHRIVKFHLYEAATQ